MKKSLQPIEGFYVRKGLTGSKLRKALENDKEYQEILTERKAKLAKKIKVAPKEKQEYFLSTDRDYKILDKIKQLEKQKLSAKDRGLIKFIRTQLRLDWRTPLIRLLDNMLKKHK